MSEAEALNKGFLKRMRTGFLLFIIFSLNWALPDGRTAMASGESQCGVHSSPQPGATFSACVRKSHAILTSSDGIG